MKAFFGDGLLLSSPAAETLYREVADLPIIDYHCHLNEKEIRDGHKFANLGELWLGGDHYNWRLMRAAGLPERLITGDAPEHDMAFETGDFVAAIRGEERALRDRERFEGVTLSSLRVMDRIRQQVGVRFPADLGA